MFAAPVAKSTILEKGGLELLSSQEDTQQKEIPLSHTTGNGAEMKPTKAHYPKGNTKARDKRWKGSSSIEKKVNHEKDPGISKNEKDCLTDAQFEEIVQSVLQKPLQECLEYSGKRLALVKSVEKESLRRETLETSRTVGDAVPGKASQAKDEKPEADNGGCKENRKGVPKKKVQGNACNTVGREEMQEEEEADRGSGSSWCMAWVQCSYPTCEKWRRLSNDIDPSVLPEDWSCSQNPDLQHNNCSIPEETCSGSENEVVYAVYIPGSIVWAKQYGYPWWPGMVEADPDIGEYFLFSSQKDSLPSKYHVTFFGNIATRAWISASMLRNFDDPDVERHCLKRIKRFGFDNRFSGRESPDDQQDLKDVICKPCAKRTLSPSGRKKNRTTSDKNPEKKTTNGKGHKRNKLTTEGNYSLSKKSQKDMSPPTDAAVSQEAGKRKVHQDDQKDNSGNQSKKDSLKIKDSHVAESKAVLTKSIVGLEESNGSMAAMGDEEGGFGSQEMTVC